MGRAVCGAAARGCGSLGRLLLLLTILSLGLPAAAQDKDFAVIELDFRQADEVLPLVEPLLSPTGRVAADARTNSLVVVDTPQAIARVRRFIGGSDRPGRQVTVKIRFGQAQSRRGHAIQASGRVSGDHGSVSVGGRFSDGVTVRIDGQRQSRRSRSEYFVRVLSGSTAYIWAGKEVPYTQQWGHWCRRYARSFETVTFKTIETGFDVHPVVTGSRANIRVMPRISGSGGQGTEGVIRFAEASTELAVPLGQWVDIAGGRGGGQEVRQAILATGGRRSGQSLRIELMVMAD